MNRRAKYFLCVIMIPMWWAARARASAISVENWTLRATVGIGAGVDSRVNTTPESPFALSQYASLQSSTAASIYTASWDAAGFFHFFADVDHACQGDDDNTSCRSTGTILLTPQVDSFLSITSEYNYVFAPGDREAIMSILTYVAEPPFVASIDYFRRHLTLGGQTAGQIAFQSPETLLQAGVPYAVDYRLDSRSFTGNANELSLGNGFIDITVQPVPSPSSGTVLLIGAAALLRRTRRGRCAS